MPKQARNAFFFFMLDFKKKEEKMGKVFMGGLKDVANAADPLWKQLSKEEKEPYEQRAKAEKGGPKVNTKCPDKYSSGKERYTSDGIPLSRIEHAEQEKADKMRMQQDKVDSIITFGVDNNLLLKQPFYLLTFNYFIKDSDDNYMPCEMGLIKFSFEKGVSEKLHSLINPGKLPSGYTYSAMSHAKETHQLPLPPHAKGETDFAVIVQQIKDFIQREQTVAVSKTAFVFVMEDEEKMIQNILEGLCDTAQVDSNFIRVLPLTYFFKKLRTTLEDFQNATELTAENEFTTATAQLYFDRDIYRYEKGNGCDLHEVEMNFHCAVSRVTRWAYVILNQTMDLAGITKKLPGFHLPMNYLPTPIEKFVENVYDDVTTETESIATETETDTASVVTVKSSKSKVSSIFKPKVAGLNEKMGVVGVTKKHNESLEKSFSNLHLFENRLQQARKHQPLDQSYIEKFYESLIEDDEALETERGSSPKPINDNDSDTESVVTVDSRFNIGFDDSVSTASFRRGSSFVTRGNFRQGRLIRSSEQSETPNPFTMFKSNLEGYEKNPIEQKRVNLFERRKKQAAEAEKNKSKISSFTEKIWESFYESESD